MALAGAAGALTGSVLGGALGFFVGAVLMTIPGVGPVVVTGLLLSTLAGAGIGAASVGLISALTEWGIPMDEATTYETYVGQGHILLLVQATTEAQARAVQVVFVHHNGVEVRTYGPAGEALPSGTLRPSQYHTAGLLGRDSDRIRVMVTSITTSDIRRVVHSRAGPLPKSPRPQPRSCVSPRPGLRYLPDNIQLTPARFVPLVVGCPDGWRNHPFFTPFAFIPFARPAVARSISPKSMSRWGYVAIAAGTTTTRRAQHRPREPGPHRPSPVGRRAIVADEQAAESVDRPGRRRQRGLLIKHDAEPRALVIGSR